MPTPLKTREISSGDLLITAFLLAISVFLVFLMGRYPGIAPDSVSYLRISSNPLGSPGVSFPPAYPFILRILSVHGLPDLWKISVFNGACFFISFFLLWRIHRIFLSPVSAGLLTIFCSLHVPLIEPYMWIASESLFMPLFLFCVLMALKETKGFSVILLATALLALPVIRLAGCAVIAFSLIYILQRQRHHFFSKKNVLPVLGLILAPAAFLFLFAKLNNSTILFERDLNFYPSGITKWLHYPRILQTVLPYRLVDSFAGFFLVAGLWAVILQGRNDSRAAFLILWILFYYLFIFSVLILITPLIPIDFRIMLPANVFLPLLFVRGAASTPSSTAKKALAAAMAVMCFFTILNFKRFAGAWQLRENTGGYSSPLWRKDPAIKWIKEQNIPYSYSTHEDVIYLFTGLPATGLSVLGLAARGIVYGTEEGRRKTLEEIKEAVLKKRSAVVYFARNNRTDFVPEEDVRKTLGMDPVVINGTRIYVAQINGRRPETPAERG